MNEKSLIIDIVADYNLQTSDLAFAEVKNKFNSSFIGMITNISYFGVSPFNTIENGFFVSQLAITSKIGKNHLIFHNVAPRKDDIEERIENDGEKLAFSILPNNVLVVGVLSGYSFSFINEISEIYVSKCPTSGSQFRSRDIFPEYTKLIYDMVIRNQDFSGIVESKIKIGEMKQIPQNTITYIDGYGNIKIYGDFSKIQTENIEIEINGVLKKVKFNNKKGIFSVKDGDLVFSKGSSGWITSEKQIDFYEIVLRGGNASQSFKNAKPGDEIKINF